MNLDNFYGTENYYRSNPFVPKMMHTDGVEYFCKEGGAYWFLDIIATEVYPMLREEPFISIALEVEDGSAMIYVQDGNEKDLLIKKIEFTDCPNGEYSFFLTDNVLMLTSEY
jgi:hypothetical protein